MKKLLSIVAGLILLPSVALAITVPWNKVTPGQVYPPLVGDQVLAGTTTATTQGQVVSQSPSTWQYALSQGAGLIQWALRALGSEISISPTNVGGTATTSSPFKISGIGFGTTTITGLTINGQATSTSNVGFNISTGCYAIGNNCLSTGGGTVTSVDVSGGTSGLTFTGGPITTAGTITLNSGQLTVPFGGTGAGSFTSSQLLYGAGTGALQSVATGTITCSGSVSCGSTSFVVGPNLTITGSGLTSYDAWTHPAAGVSATTSEIRMNGFVSTASSTIVASATTTGTQTTGNVKAITTTATSTFDGGVGIASSTPWSRVGVGAGNAVTIGENNLATSSTISVDWRAGNQQLVRLGGAGVTINFSGYIDGQTLRLIACSPAGTAGAITWGTQVLWTGGSAPSQTTTANKCDVWSFIATKATSTLTVFGAMTPNF